MNSFNNFGRDFSFSSADFFSSRHTLTNFRLSLEDIAVHIQLSGMVGASMHGVLLIGLVLKNSSNLSIPRLVTSKKSDRWLRFASRPIWDFMICWRSTLIMFWKTPCSSFVGCIPAMFLHIPIIQYTINMCIYICIYIHMYIYIYTCISIPLVGCWVAEPLWYRGKRWASFCCSPLCQLSLCFLLESNYINP